MRSIRARLFFSIGGIFLSVAVLSFLLPNFYVKKDIDAASAYLNAINKDSLKKIQQISGSWVTYRFIREAAELAAVSQLMQPEGRSLWEIAASLIGQDPEIALVQAADGDRKTALISQEGARDYIPLWAEDPERQQLWIKIPEKEKLLRAEPLENKTGSYLLLAEPKEKRIETLSFNAFDAQAPLPTGNDTLHIYEALHQKEAELYEKAKMIRLLAPYAEKAAGILHVDAQFKKGRALLAEELFSTVPVVDVLQPSSSPFVIYRAEGPFVDLMQFSSQSSPYLVIGYSLSTIASQIASMMQKPVILSQKGTPLQAFSPNGETLPLSELQIGKESIWWHNKLYLRTEIPIGPINFTMLVSEEERDAVPNVLNQVKTTLITKLSTNLIVTALLLFILAMFVLARISKRIASPITQLAVASEEIGRGKYEDLSLPPVEKREDEIAILSHSFQKMVISLRDREKIRGVLNKVVSKEIASTILNSNIELGGETRTLTMLFSDIRGFTPLSEILPPQTLIRLLNSYMTRMCRIIDETNGVVDKFVGDEIMALYGAPLPLKNHVEKAVEAAVLMIQDLTKWNQERGAHAPQITVGIGIHTGDAFAGNMGAEDRLNYTVVGANVNLAARLCSAAEPMQILVSEETYLAITDREKFHFRKLTPIALKGIDHPVPIYEVLILKPSISGENTPPFRGVGL